MIVFNKPYITGKEQLYIEEAIANGKLSGNGFFTKKCQVFFEKNYGFKKTLLTTSCTDALEMCAILANIKAGDEVIIPSYTFVSTALAFIRQGAKIIFADSRKDHPGIDESKIESLITSKTKAIVPVHYAGVACDMDLIMDIANRYDLLVIEDAAQGIDSYYKGRALGTIGHLSAFSFHETKNIHCGEGGLLGINDERFVNRAEIIWEKGTNRSQFFRGEVNKYGWIDTGSSFLPSELNAAFLWAQLEGLNAIQKRRLEIWEQYDKELKDLPLINKRVLPEFATKNGHMYYLLCNSLEERTKLITFLKENNIHAVFHYLSLHDSDYYKNEKIEKRILEESDRYTNTLVRLPLYAGLSNDDIDKIIKTIKLFFNS
ncbi:dTDP-4-amino-4,6-dideoxygalactose transaminase [Flavobacteriaceae bacterium UJ101]|nr:dTDP-4-amino-4,6-dideoxygalactose transaminase [Flavobacteriaceae bacterium UJ101]